MKNEVLISTKFGRLGNSESHQLYGWAHGEFDFTWTLSNESALIFEKFECPHGFFVEMQVIPRLRPEGPARQRLEIVINGQSIGACSINSGADFGFYCPSLSPSDTKIIVIIRHPDAFKDHSESPDFAIAFKSVRLIKLLEPWINTHLSLQETNSIILLKEDNNTEILNEFNSKVGVSAAKVLKEFEIIAGNCEFGGIQRLCDLEPLSLLRFAGASISSTIEGLDCGFSGLGENLEAKETGNGIKEWMVFEKKYHLNFHTFISVDKISNREAENIIKRKISFLLRKFLEDLSENNKVFVCVDRFQLPLEAIFPIFLALGRQGANRLLWIRVCLSDEIPGSVETIAPGLYVGKMDRLSAHGMPSEGSLKCWLTLLRNAWILI